jgi:hypothetical protein
MRMTIAIVLIGVLIAGCNTVKTDKPICRVPDQCVGTWLEIEQFGGGGIVVTPKSPIKKFVIESDGSFSVTWQPFETYCDFWGTCHFPSGTNTALFYVLSGNHIPAYFDGRGSYRFRNGNLVFDDLFFGHPRAEQDKLKDPVKAIFGHKFKKVGPPPIPPKPAARICRLCRKEFKVCPGCHSVLTELIHCHACRMDICPNCVLKPEEEQSKK